MQIHNEELPRARQLARMGKELRWRQVLSIRFADRFAKGIRGTARDIMVAEPQADSKWDLRTA
jgi:hypothetical protein